MVVHGGPVSHATSLLLTTSPPVQDTCLSRHNKELRALFMTNSHCLAGMQRQAEQVSQVQRVPYTACPRRQCGASQRDHTAGCMVACMAAECRHACSSRQSHKAHGRQSPSPRRQSAFSVSAAERSRPSALRRRDTQVKRCPACPWQVQVVS